MKILTVYFIVCIITGTITELISNWSYKISNKYDVSYIVFKGIDNKFLSLLSTIIIVAIPVLNALFIIQEIDMFLTIRKRYIKIINMKKRHRGVKI